MTPRARRAKALRLAVDTTEALARALNLTIEAEPPTKPGYRNGVYWVNGGEGDLIVRHAGRPGNDIEANSATARERLSIPLPSRDRLPLAFECKNTEKWNLDQLFTGRCSVAAKAIAQVEQRCPHTVPVVVLGRNLSAPLVVGREAREASFPVRPVLIAFGLVAIQLKDFITLIKIGKLREVIR